MKRRQTSQLFVGDVGIGSEYPISIQSMTNTQTSDVDGTVAQILRLEDAGCDLIRMAINSLDDAAAIQKIRSRIHIPIIADVQFDYRLAVAAARGGVDGLRINPGNIGETWKVKEVVEAAKERDLSIRIGVNAGSLHQKYIDAFHGVNAESICASGLDEAERLESLGFSKIKVSLKSSQVMENIEAYRLFAARTSYPLHLGVTEAGRGDRALVKSAIGIGTLLAEGIGDTLRVSLTDHPYEEVIAGRQILASLGIRPFGVEIISCPTCARTKIDLFDLVKRAEERLTPLKKPLRIAIMGCVVNGPGEAREADFGITGGDGVGIIFRRGEILRKVQEEVLLDALVEEIERSSHVLVE